MHKREIQMFHKKQTRAFPILKQHKHPIVKWPSKETKTIHVSRRTKIGGCPIVVFTKLMTSFSVFSRETHSRWFRVTQQTIRTGEPVERETTQHTPTQERNDKNKKLDTSRSVRYSTNQHKTSLLIYSKVDPQYSQTIFCHEPSSKKVAQSKKLCYTGNKRREF